MSPTSPVKSKLLVISHNGQVNDVLRFQSDQDVNTFLHRNHFRISVDTVRSPGIDSVLVNPQKEVGILMTIPSEEPIDMIVMTEEN